jgi:hypothetical protein
MQKNENERAEYAGYRRFEAVIQEEQTQMPFLRQKVLDERLVQDNS